MPGVVPSPLLLGAPPLPPLPANLLLRLTGQVAANEGEEPVPFDDSSGRPDVHFADAELRARQQQYGADTRVPAGLGAHGRLRGSKKTSTEVDLSQSEAQQAYRGSMQLCAKVATLATRCPKGDFMAWSTTGVSNAVKLHMEGQHASNLGGTSPEAVNARADLAKAIYAYLRVGAFRRSVQALVREYEGEGPPAAERGPAAARRPAGLARPMPTMMQLLRDEIAGAATAGTQPAQRAAGPPALPQLRPRSPTETADGAVRPAKKNKNVTKEEVSKSMHMGSTVVGATASDPPR